MALHQTMIGEAVVTLSTGEKVKASKLLMFALSSALTPVTAGLRLVTQGRGAPSRAGSTVSASRYVLRFPAASAVYGFVGLPWAGDVAAGYQPRMDKLRMNSSKWNCWPRPVASSGSLHPVACHSGELPYG